MIREIEFGKLLSPTLRTTDMKQGTQIHQGRSFNFYTLTIFIILIHFKFCWAPPRNTENTTSLPEKKSTSSSKPKRQKKNITQPSNHPTTHQVPAYPHPVVWPWAPAVVFMAFWRLPVAIRRSHDIWPGCLGRMEVGEKWHGLVASKNVMSSIWFIWMFPKIVGFLPNHPF